MIKLVVKAQLTEGGTKDYSYEFDQPLITIGRLKENDIQLPSSTVSGYHAQIVKEGDNYYLVDRGSINGSSLNGQRLVPGEKKLLSDSDLIKIQSFELYFSTGINVLNIDSGATVQVARQMVMEVLGSWQTSAADKPRVILMGGPDNGKQFELSEGTNLVAGRTAGVEIVIEHPSVSRRHAEISLSWSGAFIKDLNSANGTFVNDQRIAGSRRMRDRDEIRLGQQSSSAPVILLFSNPAEALLSKLEDMQMTDSQPGVMQSKDVTDAAAKEGERLAAEASEEQVEKSEGDAAEAVPEADQEEQSEGPPPLPEGSMEIPAPPQTLRKMLSSPLGIIGAAALIITLLILVIIIIIPPPPIIPKSAIPDKGSTGDLIRIKGEFDPEDVKAVKILEKDAFVLKRDENGLEIRLPDFPQLSTAQQDTEILVMGEKEDVIARINFKVLIAPRIQSMNPHSGGVGTEVRIQTNMPGQKTSVLFDKDIAGTRLEGQDIIAIVPSPTENIPEKGLKVPVTIRINDLPAKNSFDFIILPEAAVPLEVFKLAFIAKPYPTSLGFNEYSIETNLGPQLILAAKDDASSSRERAEVVAKNLNNAVTYFQSNPDAQIAMSNQENAYLLVADGAVDGTKSPLLRVLPEDVFPYSKLNQRGVQLEELAKWWQMLLWAYFRTFVQAKSPEDTGIIAAGGLVFQQVVNFYAVGNDKDGRYYPKNLLDTLTADQKTKLIALSHTLPARVAKVEGSWSGSMENKLYSDLTDAGLELDLKLRQQGNSISGRATLTLKKELGGSGSFQNVFRKTVGSYSLFGQYRKTSSFPVEFSITERDGRTVDFVGKMEGNSLRGTYIIRSSGQEGSWSVSIK